MPISISSRLKAAFDEKGRTPYEFEAQKLGLQDLQAQMGAKSAYAEPTQSNISGLSDLGKFYLQQQVAAKKQAEAEADYKLFDKLATTFDAQVKSGDSNKSLANTINTMRTIFNKHVDGKTIPKIPMIDELGLKNKEGSNILKKFVNNSVKLLGSGRPQGEVAMEIANNWAELYPDYEAATGKELSQAQVTNMRNILEGAKPTYNPSKDIELLTSGVSSPEGVVAARNLMSQGGTEDIRKLGQQYLQEQGMVTEEKKAPSASQMKAGIVQKKLNDGSITEDEAIQLLDGKGITITKNPDGSWSVQVGGTGTGKSTDITKPAIRTIGDIQQRLVASQGVIDKLKQVKDIAPEDIAGGLNRLLIFGKQVIDWASPWGANFEQVKQDDQFNEFIGDLKIIFTKAATGAQFSEKELKRYDRLFPNLTWDGAERVKNKLEAVRIINENNIKNNLKFATATDFLNVFEATINQIESGETKTQKKKDYSNLW